MKHHHPIPSDYLTDQNPAIFFQHSNPPTKENWSSVQLEKQTTESGGSFNHDHANRRRTLVFGKT
ncbi:MAG: hypothetical protein CMJ81_15125 [Planctomycetaceae bacterium]|jgi:hypothetical protein|nr:hypothetical protein [Planctomycetaceae bacterium]